MFTRKDQGRVEIKMSLLLGGILGSLACKIEPLSLSIQVLVVDGDHVGCGR